MDPRLEYSYWLTLSPERLERKLKAEDRRRLQMHWAYDQARHNLMVAAYREVKSKSVRA